MKLIKSSVGEVIKKDFMLANGFSEKSFAMNYKLNFHQLHYTLRGGNPTFDFIYYLSKATDTSANYWIDLHCDYMSSKLNNNLSDNSQTSIKSKSRSFVNDNFDNKKLNQSSCNYLLLKYGETESDEYLTLTKYFKQKEVDLNFLYDIKAEDLHLILNVAENKKRINFEIAQKLHALTKREPILWLQDQLFYDIENYLKQRKGLSTELIEQLNGYKYERNSSRNSNEENKHPGLILNEKLVNEFNLPISFLYSILLTSKKRLKNILAGKAELTLPMIVKLSLIFKTSVKYWLDIQLNHFRYIDTNGIFIQKPILNSNPNTPDSKKEYLDKSRYVNNQEWKITLLKRIKDRNLTFKELAKQMGVSDQILYNVSNNLSKITVELAHKLSCKLGESTFFWMSLQWKCLYKNKFLLDKN